MKRLNMRKQNYITKIRAVFVAWLALVSAPKAEELNTMEIVIKDKVYAVELAENQTTDALKKMLPLTIDMSELHGNEKYYYLERSLPTNAKPAGKISNGDIMLFGDDCLVVFYKSFDNPYSYNEIYIETIRAEICYTCIYQQNVCRVRRYKNE